MTNEERKRLEESATEYAINDDSLIDSCDTTSVSAGFIAGAEWGYKEAIALAKEWLSDCIHNEEHISSHPYRDDKIVAQFDFDNDKESILSCFEREMNQFWEERI